MTLAKEAKELGYVVVRNPDSPFGQGWVRPPYGLKRGGKVVATGTQASLRNWLRRLIWTRPLKK